MSPLSYIGISPNNRDDINAIILNAISELGEGLFILEGKKIVYANDACTKISGYSQEELYGLRSLLDVVTPDQYDGLLERFEKRLRGEKVSDHYRTSFVHKDGYAVHIEVAVKVLHLGLKPQFLVLARDVTHEEASKASLKQVQERLLRAQRAANIGTFEWDFSKGEIFWTGELEQIYGLEPGGFKGTSEHWRSFTHPEDIELLAEANKLALENASEVNVEFRIILDNGSKRWVSLKADILVDDKGNSSRMVGIVMDITEKKKTEELMTYQATHDPLTGLPNRKGLDEQFLIARNQAMRNRHMVGVMFVDLDRFKNINDTLGHAIGDTILKEAAQRFKSVVRNTDTVARLGGDEFIILVSEVRSSKDMVRAAQKVLKALEDPFMVDNNTLYLSTSIGIALCPQDGEDIFTLFKHSDIALYRAKEAGRNRFQFYDYAMNIQSHAKLSLENDLRGAVSRKEFLLHYQPIVNKETEVIGVEVLLRWNHPRLGMLSPLEIIPLAEETGLIVPIGQWVLETALLQHKRWLREKLLDCKISINYSGRQFSEHDMVEKLQKTLEHLQYDPQFLELEITESIAMESAERTRNKFADLRNMKVSISIDDFGTGYSSLSYLKNFPVSRVKIDKSFVRYCLTDASDAAIIRAITTMAENLDFTVVAEGVETAEQFKMLIGEGVDGFQGYHISRPVPASEFSAWLQKKL
ncbi:MAG: EAL domain-containing protein [bacterium]|nr:EAL domain-containing protein [bacterium]